MICRCCELEFSKESMADGDICIECMEELLYDEPTRMQVTHDMAIDAGYPEMEGMWIEW